MLNLITEYENYELIIASKWRTLTLTPRVRV